MARGPVLVLNPDDLFYAKYTDWLLAMSEAFVKSGGTFSQSPDIAGGQYIRYLYQEILRRANCFINNTASGTPNAIVLNTDTTISYSLTTSIYKYEVFCFQCTYNNTGSCTINIDSQGVKSLKDYDGNDLIADSLIAGVFYTAIYNGTECRIINNQQANETISGIVKRATQTEVNVGTDENKFITPLTLQSSKIGFQANKTVTQVIGEAVLTKLTLDSVDFNYGNYFNSSTSNFTCLTAGKYLCGFAVEGLDAGVAGQAIYGVIKKNGVSTKASVRSTLYDNGHDIITCSYIINLISGDILNLYGQISGAGATTIGTNTFMYATRLCA